MLGKISKTIMSRKNVCTTITALENGTKHKNIIIAKAEKAEQKEPFLRKKKKKKMVGVSIDLKLLHKSQWSHSLITEISQCLNS